MWIFRGYDWHGASIKNVMYAIQNLADTLPGVPESLKNLPGMKPDPERLFMAGKKLPRTQIDLHGETPEVTPILFLLYSW